ncbi:unnamed protein product [Chironomus riparius]|uniref:Uncharacterized protein n=1 Tax=Chironomus riparius TaxID=315576 RepID=A0A9N9RKS9_9DIPT|nr:unnamed protein product [Chironomus riparius]
MSEERPEAVMLSNNRRWNISSITLLVAVISVALYQLSSGFFEKNFEKSSELKSKEIKSIKEPSKLKYILYDGLNRSDILITVDRVLSRLGLEKIEVSNPSNLPNDWNLLWTFYYHESLNEFINWSDIKHHQKVNHFSGNYMLVSKSFLTTHGNFDFIPKGFLNSEDVQKYATAHPNKRFVIKLKSSRGVKLIEPSEMNFSQKSSDYFAQEFIDDPLLWNGYKFDFNIFVVITSVNPLRVYYYKKNVFLRFCLKPYSTANISDIDAYVIGTDHIACQSFPYVKAYVEAGYTYKDAFEGFIKEIGGDIDQVWKQVENVIRSTVLIKEKYMINGINRLKASKNSFFELYRFDMILDKNLKLYLMEVNMSPCTVPVTDRMHNKLMYEHLMFNLFTLIGIGTAYEKESFQFPNYDVESMVAYHDAITVKPKTCLSSSCNANCTSDACKFCWNCLSEDYRIEMIQALQEQMNRGYFTRVFPVQKEDIKEDLWKDITHLNKFYIEWFQEMCKKNKQFC